MLADVLRPGIHTSQHLESGHILFEASSPVEVNINENIIIFCCTRNCLPLSSLNALHCIVHRCCMCSERPSANDSLFFESRRPFSDNIFEIIYININIVYTYNAISNIMNDARQMCSRSDLRGDCR